MDAGGDGEHGLMSSRTAQEPKKIPVTHVFHHHVEGFWLEGQEGEEGGGEGEARKWEGEGRGGKGGKRRERREGGGGGGGGGEGN